MLARRRTLPAATTEVVYALARVLGGRCGRDDVVDVHVAHFAMGHGASFVCALVRRQLDGACGLLLARTDQVLAQRARNQVDDACVEGAVMAGDDLYRRVRADVGVRHAPVDAVRCLVQRVVQ